MLKGQFQQLMRMSPHCLNVEKNILYREGLGRLLWSARHSSLSTIDIDEVLATVKTIEYFSGRLEKDLTILDKETSPEEEGNKQTYANNLKEFIRQNQLDKAYYRTTMCSEYYATGYDDKWMRDFWNAALDSNVSDLVCEKLKKRKIWKTVHQVIGLLQSLCVYKTTQQGQIVDAIGYTMEKPSRASRIDYLRHGVDDEPAIECWITDYVEHHKPKKKKSTRKKRSE